MLGGFWLGMLAGAEVRDALVAVFGVATVIMVPVSILISLEFEQD